MVWDTTVSLKHFHSAAVYIDTCTVQHYAWSTYNFYLTNKVLSLYMSAVCALLALNSTTTPLLIIPVNHYDQ